MIHPETPRRRSSGSTNRKQYPRLCRAIPILAIGPLLAAILPAQSWSQLSPTSSPTARYSHGMAYDAEHDEVVIFGGWASDGQTRLDDTWVFDGSTWTDVTPTPSPTPRSARMAYDPDRKVVVLFGGSGTTPTGPEGDTWEWNGDTREWTEVTSTTTPPDARFGHAMAYDGQGILMFGGRDGTPSAGTMTEVFPDTWRWNGASWSQLAVTNPPERRFHAMAYDSARGKVVLFGGSDLQSNRFADTWEWDGSGAGSWSQRTSRKNPSSRVFHTMSYDSARGRTVLFGGTFANNVFLGDTWEWTGTKWSRSSVSSPAGGRIFTALAFDSARNRNVLFGGWGAGFVANDTWEYGPSSGGGGKGKGKKSTAAKRATNTPDTWENGSSAGGDGGGSKSSAPNRATYTPFGTGCPGSGGTPLLGADQGSLPWIGETFTARLENLGPSTSRNLPLLILGDSSALWNTVTLPLDMNFLGMPGCSLYTNPIVTFPLSNQGGVATWSILIPNDPSYVGMSLYSQGVVSSPDANSFGMVVSNACEMRFGKR